MYIGWGLGMGMSLARMLCNLGKDLVVLSALQEEDEQFSSTRRYANFPGMVVPDKIVFTVDIENTVKQLA